MEIYGIECTIPTPPPKKDIDGYGKHPGKQVFERVIIPESILEAPVNELGVPECSNQDMEFIERELFRCLNGHFFYCNGSVTYLPGNYYYYLNYWTLENNSTPEFRESDRRFFIFFEECYNDPSILGIVRGKKRREGATSQGSCISTKIATFGFDERCGTISKTGSDAEDVFQNMIVNGFMSLPFFLQPRIDASTNPKKKLLFAEPPKRGKDAYKGKKTKAVGGIKSFIDFRNTKLNSYDSGRFSFVLIDEGGKWEEVNIGQYLLIVQKVLTEGASKVGFCYMPTTINPPNNGGKTFKDEVWDYADQFAYGRKTPNRMVRYFQPAEEGFAGFIGEFGESIKEPPTPSQLAYLIEKENKKPANKRIPLDDLKKGAAKYLDDQLAVLKSPNAIAEEKRMFPRKESDMFEFDANKSDFNLQNVLHQLEQIKDKPPLRRGRLVRDFTEKVIFKDDENGAWRVHILPKLPNDITISNGIKTANQAHSMRIGGDPFRNNTAGKYGSKGTLCVGSVYDSSIPDKTGIIHAFYKDRPKDKDAYFEQALMAAEFWSASVTFEEDATDDYVPFFREKGAIKMLNRTPDAALNITKPLKLQISWGVKSSNPFQLAKQLEMAIIYIEHYCHKIFFPDLLNDILLYKHDERTPRDETIAFMMWVLSILGNSKAVQANPQPKQWLPKVHYAIQW